MKTIPGETMTREAFIRKWLDNGRTWCEITKDEMRDDLDKVIAYHSKTKNQCNETQMER